MSPIGDRGGLPPGIQQGEPLVVLPGRSAVRTVEGALLATYQLSLKSEPEVCAGLLRRVPTERVEWDGPKRVARVGRDPEITATRTDLEYDNSVATLNATGGRGRLIATPQKWLSWQEYRVELRASMRHPDDG